MGEEIEKLLIVTEDLYQQEVPEAVKQEPNKKPAAETIIKMPKKPAEHLFSIKQRKEESMKQFIDRFNEEAEQVQGFSDDIAIRAMMLGLLGKPDGMANWRLFSFLCNDPPKSYADLLQKASKYSKSERCFTRTVNVCLLIALVFIIIGVSCSVNSARQQMNCTLD